MTPADLLCKNTTDFRLICLIGAATIYFVLVHTIRDPEYFATPGQITSACFMCAALVSELIAGLPMVLLYAKGLRTLSFEGKNDRLDIIMSVSAPPSGMACVETLRSTTIYGWAFVILSTILYAAQISNTVIIWFREAKNFNKTKKTQ